MSTTEPAEVASNATEAPAAQPAPTRQTSAPTDPETGRSKLEIGGAFMRSQMEKTFDAIEARERGEAKPAGKVEAPKAADRAPGEDAAQRATPERGEDGKFKSTRPEAAKPEAPARDKAGAPAAAKAESLQEADKASDTSGEPAKAIAPPVSWSAAAKARWAELHPDVHAEVAKRESDVQRVLQEKATEAAKASEIIAALEPVSARLAMEGKAPAAFVRQMIEADRALQANPYEAIQEVAKLYGIDLRRLTNPAGQTEQTAAMPGADDPRLAAANARVEALEKRLDGMIEAERHREEQKLLGDIEAFKSDPKYPHFETVRAHMGALMATPGGPKTLPEAYEQAVWAHPDVRASLEAQRQAEARQRETEEARKRAAEAQRAAGLNVGSRGMPPGGSPTKGRSLRESLSKAYDRSTAGA